MENLGPTQQGASKVLPKRILVTGSAGTGKTEMFKIITEDLRDEKNIVGFNTSSNNLNAISMPGQTLASVLSLRCKKKKKNEKEKNALPDKIIPLTPNQLRKFQSLTNIGPPESSSVKCIWVEEISNLAPFHLAQLSEACKQATGVQEAFGGLHVFMGGDFFQLGPVCAGTALAPAVVDVCIHKRRRLVEEFNSNKRHKKDRIPVLKRGDPKLALDHPFRIGAEWLTPTGSI